MAFASVEGWEAPLRCSCERGGFLSPLRWTLVISCFFDDSGKESDLDNRIVCAAGYMGLDNFWDMFNQAWAHHLMRHGISWLHMKDFMLSRDEYALKGWDWPAK